MSAIASKLESIVGAGGMVAWEQLSPEMQDRLNRAIVPKPNPIPSVDCVVYPESAEQLAEVMTCAARHHWRVLPMGAGSKLHWGGLAEGIQVAISTARMSRLIDHAVGDLTVTAEAGLGLASLQSVLNQERQFLALDPTFSDQATLGGIVATADTGALRQRYGGVRDMVIGISLVRSDGQMAKAGGRVVKNVAGYDLMKLFTGSFGTLGLITQLTFRVYPVPDASRTMVLLGTAEGIAQAAKTILGSALTPTAIELVSPETSLALNAGKEMALICRFQSIEVSVEQQTAQLLQLGEAIGLKGNALRDGDESALWQKLREQLDTSSPESAITCKMGVLPANGVATLNGVGAIVPPTLAVIHAASGLGTLRFQGHLPSRQQLLEIRKVCQSHGGFLSVLEAPASMKQNFDLWGYTGSAFQLMQKIKQQFDPDNLLNPHRFVGGI